MPSAGFVTEFWRDVLALIGAVGVVLTAVGLLIAFFQLRKTVSAGEAATRAAVDALNRSCRQYNHYVIAQSSQHLNEASVHVENHSWRSAAIRLGDVADLLLQVTDGDGDWSKFAERLHGMRCTFDKMGDCGEENLSASMRGKWQKLYRELSTKIVKSLTPFQDTRMEKDDVGPTEV